MLPSQNQAQQPDYELDDFTTVSEWERFTSNAEECLREWAASSSGAPFSPTVTASTQQQLASPWQQWLLRSCDLGSVGGHRFELVRHWHESTANERNKSPPTSPNKLSSAANSNADGNVFLDLLDSRCDFDSTPNPEPYRMFGFRDFAVLRVRQNTNDAASSYLSIQLSNLLLSSLASAATAASCSMPQLLELSSGQTGSLGRSGYTGISVSRVAVIDLTATSFNPPSRPPTHLSTQAAGHLCYWIGVMRNHLKCPLWPQPPLQLAVRYSYYIRISFPQFDPLSPATKKSGSAGDDDEEGSMLSEEMTDSEEDYEDSFLHPQQQPSTRRRRSRRRSSETSSISGESIAPNFCRLPIGIYDPNEAALEVILTWPILDDSHFTDSPVVSTSSSLDLMTGVASCRGCMLDPSTAVDWLARLWLEKQDSIAKHGNYSRCLLTDFTSIFSKMSGLSSVTTSSSSLANAANVASGGEASASTSGSAPKPDRSAHWSMRLVRHLATSASATAASLQAPNLLPDLIRILIDSWIFPKTEEQNPTADVDFRELKSAPDSSLIERVAIAACVLSASFGQTATVQFWQQVCARFQTLWDTGRPLPRADAAVPPDLKQSVIAQKVQLLAYCLGQRLRREREAASASSAALKVELPSIQQKNVGVGRLRLLDPVQKTMLVSGKDPIYIPETQEPEPMTEDELPMFPIESEVESSNGAGFQHSIPCLQSDMSSFKAANPEAELIDFLRWYSPRDVHDSSNGPTLSSRMCIPGNIWQVTWEKAKSVPARRQKRIFDETRAAHNVLRWFTALTNSGRDLTIHLLPVLLGAALRRLHREAKNVMPASNVANQVPSSRYIKEALDLASEAVIRATSALSAYSLTRAPVGGDGSGRSTPMEFEVGASSPASTAGSALAAAIDAVNFAEQRICLVAALRSKLSGAIGAGDGPVLDEFLFTIVSNCSATYNGTAFPPPRKTPTIRGVILSLISAEAPSPTAISTVIRANCPRPAAFSRSLPHRLYVRFQPNSPTPSCSHLAGAFSRDIIFA